MVGAAASWLAVGAATAIDMRQATETAASVVQRAMASSSQDDAENSSGRKVSYTFASRRHDESEPGMPIDGQWCHRRKGRRDRKVIRADRQPIMSVPGQSATWRRRLATSDLAPISDIGRGRQHVRKVPKPAIRLSRRVCSVHCALRKIHHDGMHLRLGSQQVNWPRGAGDQYKPGPYPMLRGPAS
jgi:hypothetical protein